MSPYMDPTRNCCAGYPNSPHSKGCVYEHLRGGYIQQVSDPSRLTTSAPTPGDVVHGRADFARLPVGTQVTMWSGEVKTAHPDAFVKPDMFPALVRSVPHQEIPDWLEAATRTYVGTDWMFITPDSKRAAFNTVREIVEAADKARGITA